MSQDEEESLALVLGVWLVLRHSNGASAADPCAARFIAAAPARSTSCAASLTATRLGKVRSQCKKRLFQ